MYKSYTSQSLPEDAYLEFLAVAICVFNSNNAFIIENILNSDKNNNYNWYDLIDRTSGQLNAPIKNTITARTNNADIANLFNDIVQLRNRIVHSFRITGTDINCNGAQVPDQQLLASKDKQGKQEVITSKFLMDFIKKNDELSTKLHDFRGY